MTTFSDNFDDLKLMHRISRKLFYKNLELKKQWISMNIYYRKTMKIAKMMNNIFNLQDLMKIGSMYWKMLTEFESWLCNYSTFFHFQSFRDDLVLMLNALVNHIVLMFPEKEKTFRWIDNYQRVKISLM